ncbi:hypothetical protein CORC01_04348 [Colletotrichum orchidophilum]|uniref:Uncharacterized protein n=1 Tax=Colletotrichum orchidophilum TaxID=1209926 RepID=A0A1G4BGB8_9PEZI|nr:uncharacterized protein CORC01_04348 [Colletotrichum orchidophilum]OHF00367.1 hypothetical protein CORC01_04348 [Colletotrichum orchidophilum]
MNTKDAAGFLGGKLVIGRDAVVHSAKSGKHSVVLRTSNESEWFTRSFCKAQKGRSFNTSDSAKSNSSTKKLGRFQRHREEANRRYTWNWRRYEASVQGDTGASGVSRTDGVL